MNYKQVLFTTMFIAPPFIYFFINSEILMMIFNGETNESGIFVGFMALYLLLMTSLVGSGIAVSTVFALCELYKWLGKC